MDETNPVAAADVDATTPQNNPESPTQVEIRTIGAEELEARYVNLATINYDRAALYLTLSQFPPPTITGPDDARRITREGFVTAKAIGRFVLTPLMVEEMISLLQTQLEGFRGTRQGVGTDDTEHETQ